MKIVILPYQHHFQINLVTYFLEKEGVNDCSVGEKVRDSISCEIACKNYNFPLKEMIDGLLCYRSKTGDCGADTKIGSTASLICKIDGKLVVYFQR